MDGRPKELWELFSMSNEGTNDVRNYFLDSGEIISPQNICLGDRKTVISIEIFTPNFVYKCIVILCIDLHINPIAKKTHLHRQADPPFIV